MDNIEKRVVDTILQKNIEFEAAGKSYTAPTPTLGTLLMVSEKISELPEEFGTSGEIAKVLHDAKYNNTIAEICSIYILGAKLVAKAENKAISRLFKRKPTKPSSTFLKLVNEVLFEWTPNDVNRLFSIILEKSDLHDFFGVSTFLSEVSLTKPTKVEKTN